jgi:hypothetical protein
MVVSLVFCGIFYFGGENSDKLEGEGGQSKIDRLLEKLCS